MTERTFGTIEVCQLTGMTYRQAHYLMPFVGVPTDGSGSRSRWTPVQVVRAWCLTTLVRAGVRIATAGPLVTVVDAGHRFLVVPADRLETFAADSALDCVDFFMAPHSPGATIVLQIPAKLVELAATPQAMMRR